MAIVKGNPILECLLNTNANATKKSSLIEQKYVNEICLDLLLIEIVNINNTEKKTKEVSDYNLSDNVDRIESINDDLSNNKEALFFKLENIGYRVGFGIVEKNTKDKTRLVEHLDIIKYICKEFWLLVFKKQVDNLKTNHRGVYVLQENNFRWFSRMAICPSGPSSNDVIVDHIAPYLAVPCGIIRGALAACGMNTSVVAKISQLPQYDSIAESLSTRNKFAHFISS